MGRSQGRSLEFCSTSEIVNNKRKWVYLARIKYWPVCSFIQQIIIVPLLCVGHCSRCLVIPGNGRKTATLAELAFG